MLLLTISKALLVPSSIGNNWSLSFIELFSAQMFCGKVGIGGRKFPTGTLFRSENAMDKIMPLRNVSQLSGFVSFQFKNIESKHLGRKWFTCTAFVLSNLFIDCSLQVLSSICNQRNPSNCSLLPLFICCCWRDNAY